MSNDFGTARQAGAAAVELLAALPLVALLATALFQMALAGFAHWHVHEAARLAARESFVVAQTRGDAESLVAARRLARRALGPIGRRATVAQRAPGDVTVAAELPLVAPYSQLRRPRPRLRARARFGQ